MNTPLLLVCLGILFTAIGGFLDMSRRNRYNRYNRYDDRLCISKQHFWNDGLFLVLLAIFIILYNKNNV